MTGPRFLYFKNSLGDSDVKLNVRALLDFLRGYQDLRSTKHFKRSLGNLEVKIQNGKDVRELSICHNLITFL